MKKIERINDVGVPFAEIKAVANNIQEKCTDFTVPNIATNLVMTNTGNLKFMSEDRQLTDWSLTQLGIKLGIPSSYLRKCFDAGFSTLAADNVNTWIKTKEKATVLIRCFEKEEAGVKTPVIRGVLSGRYTACDAPDVLEMTENTIPYLDVDWKVLGSFITEERMHLRLVSKEALDIDGDTLYPCIFIDSSDVGKCALHAQFGIYGLARKTGLLLPKIGVFYHQRHIGIDKTEFYLEFQKAMSYLPEIIEQAEDTITAAMSKKVNIVSPAEIESLMHEIRVKAKLSEEEAYEVIDLAKSECADSRWDIASALSEYAQGKTLEKRIEIERAAGYLL